MPKKKGTKLIRKVIHFFSQVKDRLLKGPPIYYVWVLFLLALIGSGVWSYGYQFKDGLAITGLTDQVSWGLYIGNFKVKDEALFKIAEIVCIAMGINLIFLGAEVFKELYTGGWHIAPLVYLFAGLHGYIGLVKWIWTALIFNCLGFLLFLIPATKKNFVSFIKRVFITGI